MSIETTRDNKKYVLFIMNQKIRSITDDMGVQQEHNGSGVVKTYRIE